MSTPTSPAPDLRADLMQVTTQFQTALHNLSLDTRLVDVARLALPDACARLDHVVALTEQAAHSTLDEVDQLRAGLDRTLRLAEGLPPHVRERLLALVAEQRQRCAALDAAQAYQDLTGQIIRRVTALIRGLEQDLLAIADGRSPPPRAGPAEDRGSGPAVQGLDQPAASQGDADDLLSALGL